ncbi:MAG: HAD-IA family hydrolase [Deltaproteobacteria bacterium]|nr:HAD-IA family hydrolase [Deltaproteobacteria bacterium]
MPAHYRAWVEILRPHGVGFPEDRFYALGGVPAAKIIEMLFAEAGKVADVDLLTRQKEAAFLAHSDGIRPVAKVVEIARQARGNTPMAVASGGHRYIVERTLRQLGILEWFAVLVTAEDTARHKPEPDVFLEAARRLGVMPARCTVYEDTDTGIEAARRAGMHWVDVRAL